MGQGEREKSERKKRERKREEEESRVSCKEVANWNSELCLSWVERESAS